MRCVHFKALLGINLLVLAGWLGMGAAHTAPQLISGPRVAHLTAAHADRADVFGGAVAMSRDGSVLVVGADLEASAGASRPDDNSMPGAGAAYVYERSGSGWRQIALLKAPMPLPGAGFGFSVAMADDGHTLMVGAPFEPDEARDAEGAAYVFRRGPGSLWHVQAELRAPESVRRFGWETALSRDGSVLAVAGVGNNAQAEIRVHALRAGRWMPDARLDTNRDTLPQGLAQLALSADGARLAVGLPAVGHVALYERTDAGWHAAQTWGVQLASPSPPDASPAPGSVALSADGRTLAYFAGQGEIHVQAEGAGGWTTQAQLHPAAGTPQEGFGHRLSLSANGHRLVTTGTPQQRAVFVFQREGQTWKALKALSAPVDPADLFGSSIALSGDGQLLAVGARFEDQRAGSASWLRRAKPQPDVGAVHLFRPV